MSSGVARRRRIGWLLVAGGLLAILGWGAYTGTRMARHAQSLGDHAQALSALAAGEPGGVESVSVAAAGDHLAGMRADLAAIRSLAGAFLPAGRALRWVPRYGGDLSTAEGLVEVAWYAASAGDRTYRALAPALELLGGRGDPELQAGEEVLPLLLAAQPELQIARQELAAARLARARINATQLSPRVAALVDRLDRYQPWLEMAVDGALVAPSLLGAGRARTYLILAQNNQEIRPTGGFISGVGELRVEEGRLVSLAFDDSYTVDNFQVPHEVAPVDFQQTLLGQLILFRDANWDPDFPMSAQRALDIYARDRGVVADGLVALDLDALALLVGVVEPLQVEGLDVVVTEQNAFTVVQQAWGEAAGGIGDEWWRHRKDFMGVIAAALSRRLIAGEDLDLVALGRALKRALDEKHLLVYLPQPEVAASLARHAWDGALPTGTASEDRLFVFDSNVGFNKVDARIERSVEYGVDLSDPVMPVARVVVRYRHLVQRPVGACVQEARYGDDYVALMERCYWDYVRILVPPGSELLEAPDAPVPSGSLLARDDGTVPPPPISPVVDVDGWVAWTAFFALPSAEERVFEWRYRLPSQVVEEQADGTLRYRLGILKQPGTDAVPLQVGVVLPPGAQIVRSNLGSGLEADTDLRVDRAFEVVFSPGEDGS